MRAGSLACAVAFVSVALPTAAGWFVEYPPVDSLGNVLRCARRARFPDLSRTATLLQAAAAVGWTADPAGSRCRIAIIATTTLDAAPGSTRYRVFRRLRGERRNTAATDVQFLDAIVQVGGHRLEFRGQATDPGVESIDRADSFQVCLQPGTHDLVATLTVEASFAGGAAVDSFVTAFFDGSRGMEVDYRAIEPCSPLDCPLSIGIFADSTARSREIVAWPRQLGRAYVLATGADVCGVAGVEFRIEGFPADWPVVPIPNPAAVLALGDPTVGGCNIAFDGCPSPGAGGVLHLYTLEFLATGDVRDRPLRIRESPVCHPFCCPVISLCDEPVFTRLCVPPTCSVLNGPATVCPTAVESLTWTRVKQIFR